MNQIFGLPTMGTARRAPTNALPNLDGPVLNVGARERPNVGPRDGYNANTRDERSR